MNSERTKTRRGLVEQEIYVQATKLFAERGFAGTNFQDIADAVGLTRPALYHYVSSKDELLAKLVAEITQDAANDIAAEAARADVDAAQKLRSIVAGTARRQGEHADRFRLLVRSEADLPEEIAAAHEAGRRAVLKSIAGVIEEGVGDGTFRTVDPRVAALGVLGMVNWVAWWYRPGGRDDLGAVCDELAEMAVAGLRGRDGSAAPRSAADALAVVREDLNRLERLL
ncbi:TetR/AcrR family transcriptional regulator [Cryptosporangium phraense]|uniref:TetR/AcrR family transcriptional regulator n=1 Tax=Cryptosporangium phraense TaxID=2593070 RepID=A0A545AV88_9ACTN|nr:TetR/AcrR family transcriptional regulator [Cryptosporangium phraense]TQS45224.1 TetR/AcrR family transcriptional regulator [Cryptosporangium phraense]